MSHFTGKTWKCAIMSGIKCFSYIKLLTFWTETFSCWLKLWISLIGFFLMGSNTEPALFSSSRPWCSEDLCLQDTVFGASLYIFSLLSPEPRTLFTLCQSMPPTEQHPCLHKTGTHKHSDHPPFEPRFYEGRQVSKDIHQWGWEETHKGNTLWKICRPKNDIFWNLKM